MGALKLAGVTRMALKLKDRFAAISHNHSAGDLTSGTLGVSRGGTGKDSHTSNAVLTGNGSNAVNNVSTADGAFYATSSGGAASFGTLPVAQGGTGATTAANARTNLDAAQSNGASGTLKSAEDGIGDLAASIATVEQPTATASHAKDSHFIVGNELKKATEAIASGESITSSNTTDDTLQGQIDTLRDSVARHTETKTLTTNTYGNVDLGLSVDNAIVLYARRSDSYGHNMVLFINNKKWYAYAAKNITGTSITLEPSGTEITVEICYISKS